MIHGELVRASVHRFDLRTYFAHTCCFGYNHPCAAALPDQFHCYGQHVPATAVREPAQSDYPAQTRRAQGPGAVQQAAFKFTLHDSDPDPGIAIIRPRTSSALGQQQGASSPLACRPPCPNQPCAYEADAVLRPWERGQGESVGHWIDAALADGGWGWAKEELAAQGSMWGGSFEGSEAPGDFVRVGSGAEAR